MDNVDRLIAQWNTERPDLDPSAMGVIGRIQRASRLLEKALAEYFASLDLQLWEFDIIGTLRRAGPQTAGTLTGAAMVTSGAITNRIDRLVARGLVTREVDPGNRRSVVIDLTPAGRALADEAVTGHVANEERLLAGFTGEERELLAGLLRRLLMGLGDVPGE